MTDALKYYASVLRGALKPLKDVNGNVTFWGFTIGLSVVGIFFPTYVPAIAAFQKPFLLVVFVLTIPFALLKANYTHVLRLRADLDGFKTKLIETQADVKRLNDGSAPRTHADDRPRLIVRHITSERYWEVERFDADKASITATDIVIFKFALTNTGTRSAKLISVVTSKRLMKAPTAYFPTNLSTLERQESTMHDQMPNYTDDLDSTEERLIAQ